MVDIQNGQLTSEILMQNVDLMLNPGIPGIYHLRVDMNRVFWRNRYFNSQPELNAALNNQTLEQLGITLIDPGSGLVVPPPAGYRINCHSPNDSTNISVVTGDVHAVARTMGKINDRGMTLDSGATTDLRVDVDALLSTRTGADAPRGLQGRYIAEFTDFELVRLFNDSGPLNDFPYWKKLVDCGGHNPTETAGYPLSVVVTQRLRTMLSRPAGAPLGLVNMSLRGISNDIQTRLQEQKKTLDRLRTSSANSIGAYTAMAMIAQEPSIKDVLKMSEEKKLKEELDSFRSKQEIHKTLETLKNLSIDLSSWSLSYEATLDEKKELENDFGQVGSGGITWNSDYMNRVIAGGPIKGTALEVDNQRRSCRAGLEEVGKKLGEFKKIADALRRVKSYSNAAKITSSSLNSYFDPPDSLTIKEDNIPGTFDPIEVAKKVESELSLESTEELEKKITEKKEEHETAKKGGEKGDELQLKVFEEYMKKENPGIGEDDAKRAAKYLYGRGLADSELKGAVDEIMHDMYHHDVEDDEHLPNFIRFEQRHAMRAVASVARACGVRVEGRARRPLRHLGLGQSVFWENVEFVDWEDQKGIGGYRNLTTAYFALKKILEGGGPEYLRIKKTPFVAEQMERISRILYPRFVQQIVKDYAGRLSTEDKEKMQNLKMTAVEFVEECLTNPPEWCDDGRIDHALQTADKKTARTKTYSAGKAARWAWEKPVKGTARTVKSATKGVWGHLKRNKWAYALGTASFLMPGVGFLWTAGAIGLGRYYDKLNPPKPSAETASAH